MSFDIQTLSLSEICTDISYGYTASANTEIVGPKFLRITDIQGGVVDWDTVPYCEIPESKLNKNLLSQGDIVVARTGNSTGENYMFSGDEPSVFASYLIRFKVDSNIANPHYVWLQMRTKRWWDFVSGAKSGSAQAGANATVLGKFEVTLPPKNVQDYVVDVISCLSSKISLNTSTNQTLEEMAQAIFKSWFVDFDPVKAKMNGEQPEGMDAATASLFPDKLVESELGLIPEGWEVCLLNQKSEIKYGKNLPKTKLLDEGYPVFGGNGVIGYYSSYLYEDEQVLVSCRGAASGKVLRSLPKSFITNNSLVIDLSNSVLNINYVEPYLKGCNLEEYTSGSAQPQMTVANMAPVQILVPSEDILKSFDEVVKPLKSKIRANERQNLSLAALRDTLLPKLLSGEIELGETEEMAEVN